MARRTPVRKAERRVAALYISGLASTRALEERIRARAAELERKLLDDARRLRDAMRRETSRFRLRRLEAAYLRCMHRIAMMRRAQAMARRAVEELDRLLPEEVRR